MSYIITRGLDSNPENVIISLYRAISRMSFLYSDCAVLLCIHFIHHVTRFYTVECLEQKGACEYRQQVDVPLLYFCFFFTIR